MWKNEATLALSEGFAFLKNGLKVSDAVFKSQHPLANSPD